jgi:hypothetical protein
LLSWLFFGANALTRLSGHRIVEVRPTERAAAPLWINCLGVTNRDGVGSHKFSGMAAVVDTCALRTSAAIARKNMASADELLTDPYLFVDL